MALAFKTNCVNCVLVARPLLVITQLCCELYGFRAAEESFLTIYGIKFHHTVHGMLLCAPAVASTCTYTLVHVA